MHFGHSFSHLWTLVSHVAGNFARLRLTLRAAVEEARNSKLTKRFLKSLSTVGTIVVTVTRSRVISIRPSVETDFGFLKLSKLGRVPEKALKGRAMSHNTGHVDFVYKLSFTNTP